MATDDAPVQMSKDSYERLLADAHAAIVMRETNKRLLGQLEELARLSHDADLNDICISDQEHDEADCPACSAGVAWRHAYVKVLNEVSHG